MLHIAAPPMTIDELAKTAGTTTRNVRALQTCGLLLKPEIVGRTAHYGEAHLARLIAVQRLQSDGFSIASIRILFEAMSVGRSLSEVLGLPAAPASEGPVPRPVRRGPSPDPSGDPFADSPGTQVESVTFNAGSSPPSRIRLLSDLPTTVLDPAI